VKKLARLNLSVVVLPKQKNLAMIVILQLSCCEKKKI